MKEGRHTSCKKTRIAPTPSGFLHLGNAMSFILTKELAAVAGAGILLRIDDMDGDRVRPEYVQDVFDTLNFLGIAWQEGPKDVIDFEDHYAQKLRLPLYQNALQQLRDGGHVFACTCTRAQLLRQGDETVYPGTCRHKNIPLDTPGANWRLYTDPGKELSVQTVEGETIISTLPPSMHDFIVRKKDGMPAYQLCSLVDDIHYGIDLIVRGQDLWPSTLAQHYLAHILNEKAFLQARFHHHFLVEGPDGRKLSKSAGDTSIRQLRKEEMTLADIYRLMDFRQ